MSNQFKILFADDKSSICEDLANQNQIQSHDDLTNPNPSNRIEISKNDNVSIKDSEYVAKTLSKTGKRHIDTVYGSMFQRRRNADRFVQILTPLITCTKMCRYFHLI